MASVGSFPTGVDSSIFVHSANQHRPMTPILAFRPRKYVAFAGTAECNSVGFSSNTTVDLFSRVSECTGCGGRRRRWNTQHVKAATEGSGTGDEAEEALQAAIESSKKALAVQKELLHRIAERRNIVSSIINSISDSEQPYKESKVTVSNLDAAEEIQDAAEPGKGFPGNGTPFAASTHKPSNEVPPASLKSSTGPSVEPSSFDNVSNGLKNTKEVVTSALKTSAEEDSKKKSKDTTVGAATLPYKLSRKEEDSDSMFKDSTVMTTILPDKQSTKEEQQRDNVKAPNPEDANVEVQDPTNEDVKPPPLAGANVMNVILVAFECAPWIKTGGLGDVAGALPKALARRGHRVMVVVPRYGNYAEAQDSGVRKRYKVDGQDFEVNYFHAYIDGVDFVFVDSPPFRHIQNNIYGGNHLDVLKRMILFCKAAVEVPWHVPCGGACYGDGNLAFIANDWHTALLPVYLKAYYRDNGIMKYARSVLVIHNIAHQGRGPPDDFNYVDLPPHYFDLFKLYDPIGGDHFNIFAAGLRAADRIVTVSHGYAWELKTSEGGWGLHGIINENDWKFRGIVNGIDTNDWSPELDVHLQSDGYVNYSLETLQTGKPQCKASLQRELRLPVRQDVPLIGFIGRLDNQKGVDLIAEAVPWMMGQDVQLVMLGMGRPDLEELLRKFEGEYNDKARGWVGFSVKVAHRITAGADIILMPSRFEPCGLNQLYAMRYGTIPIVHAVGGLRDTVEPFNPFEETGLGWTFSRAETNELVNALGNCLLTYRQYKESWVGLQRRGMLQDLSWDNAAQSYEDVLVAAKYQW